MSYRSYNDFPTMKFMIGGLAAIILSLAGGTGWLIHERISATNNTTKNKNETVQYRKEPEFETYTFTSHQKIEEFYSKLRNYENEKNVKFTEKKVGIILRNLDKNLDQRIEDTELGQLEYEINSIYK